VALRKATDKYHEEAKQHGVALGETQGEVKKMSETISAINADKKALEDRLAKTEVALKRRGSGGEGEKGQSEAMVEYRGAIKQFSVSGDATTMKEAQEKFLAAEPEAKAMAVNLQASGGYAVPKDMSGRMVTVIHESSPMRALASVQATSLGEIEGPVREGRISGGWTKELKSRPKTDTPELGMWSIPVEEMYARPEASQTMLEDSMFDIEGFLATEAGEEFARIEANAFTVGDGVGKPRGIATYDKNYIAVGKRPSGVQARGSVRTIKTGVNGGITDPDVLVTMKKNIKQGYRSGATWCLNPEALLQIQLLKQEDRYIWQDGLNGDPDTILGLALSEFDDLPEFAAGSISFLLANVSRTYQIADRMAFSLLRDPYSSKPMVEFYMRRRVGGDVVNFDTMVYAEATA